MSVLSRPFAALIALVAATALTAQGIVASGQTGLDGAPAVLWRMAGYFTVLTNALVALVFAAVASGLRLSARQAAALTVWMIVVGATYHGVLAGLWQPRGLAWWADQGLHTAMPVLVTLWWLAFAPHRGLTLRHVPGWLIWPALYGGYAVTRGLASGFWSYPFLDVSTQGAVGVAANLAVMIAVFAAVGAVLVGAASLIR